MVQAWPRAVAADHQAVTTTRLRIAHSAGRNAGSGHVLLAGMLKYEGIFTLQAKGDGAVRTLVADVSSDGALRAYAQYDSAKLADLPDQVKARTLLGNGYMAFTVDQADSSERYQGLVDLQGDSLTDFIHHYFRQSEQIDTGFMVAVRHTPLNGWQAGGIMLQRLPEQSAPVTQDTEDGWRRVMMLLGTTTPEELTAPHLSSHELLYRLFHEEEVRVYDPQDLHDRCRCSREKVQTVLRTLPQEDIEHLTESGPAEVRCEFCARAYHFTATEIATLKNKEN
jgi:molecular chaperone Hsp33